MKKLGENSKKSTKLSREEFARRMNIIIGSIVGLVCLVIIAVVFFSYSLSGSKPAPSVEKSRPNNNAQQPKETAHEVETKALEDLDKNSSATATLEKEKQDKVKISTPKGDITIAVFPELMPVTVSNFLNLVQNEFYNGLKFHRVEDWVIQGGDPKGNGTGGSDKTIKLETNPKLKNLRGMVAMARSSEPDSASSQFYILKKDASWLDEQYAVFGRVISGMEIVDGMQANENMVEVKEIK